MFLLKSLCEKSFLKANFQFNSNSEHWWNKKHPENFTIEIKDSSLYTWIVYIATIPLLLKSLFENRVNNPNYYITLTHGLVASYILNIFKLQ